MPDAKSWRSTRAVRNPRAAASRATPAPVTPPPTTSTSKRLSARRARARWRSKRPTLSCGLAGTPLACHSAVALRPTPLPRPCGPGVARRNGSAGQTRSARRSGNLVGGWSPGRRWRRPRAACSTCLIASWSAARHRPGTHMHGWGEDRWIATDEGAEMTGQGPQVHDFCLVGADGAAFAFSDAGFFPGPSALRRPQPGVGVAQIGQACCHLGMAGRPWRTKYSLSDCCCSWYQATWCSWRSAGGHAASS